MNNLSDSRDCAFEAFITNLGKYNEGELVGEWVKFPITNDEMQEVFKRIGIGRAMRNGLSAIMSFIFQIFMTFAENMKV